MFQPGGSRKQGINAPVPDTGFVTEPTLVNCNLLISTDDYTQGEFIRKHATPIHEHHNFKQLLRILGPTCPEIKILATFVKYCRKVYQNAKFLKAYIENISGEFTMKDIKEYHTKATDNLYELGVLFDQMVKFVHKIPEVLKQEQFNDVVDISTFQMVCMNNLRMSSITGLIELPKNWHPLTWRKRLKVVVTMTHWTSPTLTTSVHQAVRQGALSGKERPTRN